MDERRHQISARAISLAQRTDFTYHHQFNHLLWGNRSPMQGFLRDNPSLSQEQLSSDRYEIGFARDWVDAVCRAALGASDIALRIGWKDLVPIAYPERLRDNKLRLRLSELDRAGLKPHLAAAIYNQKPVFKQFNDGGEHDFPFPGSLDQMGEEASLTYLFYVETDNPTKRWFETVCIQPARLRARVHEIRRQSEGYPLRSANFFRVWPPLPASNPGIESFFLELARTEGKIEVGRFWLEKFRQRLG